MNIIPGAHLDNIFFHIHIFFFCICIMRPKLPKHLLKILIAFIVFAIMYHFFFNTYTTEHFYRKQGETDIKVYTTLSEYKPRPNTANRNSGTR
jgi:hypothetical protein